MAEIQRPAEEKLSQEEGTEKAVDFQATDNEYASSVGEMDPAAEKRLVRKIDWKVSSSFVCWKRAS